MEMPVYIIGDIHGKFEKLMFLIKDTGIRDCYLICVGDLGIGFQDNYYKEHRTIARLNDFFSHRDIKFMSIRGNHDDPDYFIGGGRINLDNFELIEDYTYKTINDQQYLFVGGAVSIDRRIRSLNKNYWEKELFVLKPELIEKSDVLITHSTPLWIGPFDKAGIFSWCEKDSKLWDLCVKEREDVGQLVKLSQPSKVYFGHFHISEIKSHGDCQGRILNELEILEHRK